ncbi:MAG TPA: hypothetical protein VGM06_01845 [Polyangiaceae bacterium]|jgi:hypothetical protein
MSAAVKSLPHPKSIEERYTEAFATAICGGAPWPPPPDDVVDFCARVNQLCGQLAWDAADGQMANGIAMQDLMTLTSELLMVAADDVRRRSRKEAAE